MITKWYRSVKLIPISIRAIICPGSIDGTAVQQLMANWNILAFITRRVYYRSGGAKPDYKLPPLLMIELSLTGTRHPAVAMMDTVRTFDWILLHLLVHNNGSDLVSNFLSAEIINIVSAQ
ncbi:hypothetical protein BV898_17002 [Hypsibius exemplaris]|uniref:Uncharacterized protein n=1 Tax=Hypsibius exemplaris TaxID=2072580 RepID=A0A9X6RMD4_HYPEX|nr:hypothetical protein BV898_17002 [Hypsibius exemplaris]